jgi:hypothetical protein
VAPKKLKNPTDAMHASQPSLGKPKKPKKMIPDPGPPRELIINYTDDPGVIHRGEILPFHIKKQGEEENGSKGGGSSWANKQNRSQSNKSPDRYK